MKTTHKPNQHGFTLVELSIVLVIIGLIVGGVLVGRDLISAAEIRATVQQIEKYNSSVNTFRTRFNGLPGDLRIVAAPLTDNPAGTAIGNGDGNRILESSTGGAGGIASADGEITAFWQHLSQSELIDGFFDGNQAAAVAGANGAVEVTFPRAKIDRQGIGVFGTAGFNYFQIGQTDTPAGGVVNTYANALTPSEASNIDVKVDDGRPFTGQTTARGGAVPNAAYVVAAATAAGTCALGDDATPDNADTYDVGNTGVVCQLRLRMN